MISGKSIDDIHRAVKMAVNHDGQPVFTTDEVEAVMAHVQGAAAMGRTARVYASRVHGQYMPFVPHQHCNQGECRTERVRCCCNCHGCIVAKHLGGLCPR